MDLGVRPSRARPARCRSPARRDRSSTGPKSTMPRVPARSASAIRLRNWASTQGVLLAGCVEPLERELPDRLEHPEALLAVRIGAAADEALVEQRRQRVEVGAADLLRVLERGAAAEHREPGEERLLVLAEQVVAPRDRGAQRGMALVGVTAALEEVEPLPDPLEQLLRAEQLDPRGGELDREREAVEAADQLVDGGRVTDVGADRLRALEEQRDGVGLDHRRQVELDLAGDPQRLPARRDDPERRARPRAARRSAGPRRAAAARGCRGRRAPACRRGGSRSRRPCRRRRRGRRRSGARPAPHPERGRAGRRPCPPSASSARNRASSIENRVLPVPPGPDDREQARVALEPQRGRVEELPLAAEEVRRRSGKVDGARGSQRWELARPELEQLRRGIEVLQSVAPEVAQRLILDERCRRGREDHLAAVGEGGDAGAAVDVDPDVALGRNARRARMEPHPHGDRPRRERLLRGGRSRDGRRLRWGTRRRTRRPACRPRHRPRR